MSPEQLKKLQKLGQIFEKGSVNPSQVKELSTLLTDLNRLRDEKKLRIELLV